jgi:cardiolipin synthase
MQITLVVAILAQQAGLFALTPVVQALIYAVFVTTVSSGVHYLWIWIVMKEIEPAETPHE